MIATTNILVNALKILEQLKLINSQEFAVHRSRNGIAGYVLLNLTIC